MKTGENSTFDQLQLISRQLMSAYEYQSISFYYPYCFDIQTQSGTIKFYGTEHFRGSDNYQFEPICSMIRVGRPDIVLVEHHQELHYLASEATRSRFLSQVGGLTPADAVSHSESRLAVYLAAEIGARVECPEPTYREQWNFLYACGYSVQQIAVYFLTRTASMAPFWHGLMTLPQLMDFRIAQLIETWPWERELLSTAFVDSFLSKHYGIALATSSPEVLRALVSPIKSEMDLDFCVLNAIAAAAMNFVDAKMVLRIVDLSALYESILVVFGASHVVRQERALRTLLRA